MRGHTSAGKRASRNALLGLDKATFVEYLVADACWLYDSRCSSGSARRRISQEQSLRRPNDKYKCECLHDNALRLARTRYSHLRCRLFHSHLEQTKAKEVSLIILKVDLALHATDPYMMLGLVRWVGLGRLVKPKSRYLIRPLVQRYRGLKETFSDTKFLAYPCGP